MFTDNLCNVSGLTVEAGIFDVLLSLCPSPVSANGLFYFRCKVREAKKMPHPPVTSLFDHFTPGSAGGEVYLWRFGETHALGGFTPLLPPSYGDAAQVQSLLSPPDPAHAASPQY